VTDAEYLPADGGLGKLSQFAATLWLLAALVGFLSAFDILIVGEELSLLGDRAHTYFGRLPDTTHYWGELTVGLSAFGLSAARLVAIGGLFARCRWGYVMAAILVGPFAFLDICMWSPPYAAVAVIADIYLLGVAARRLAS